MKNLLKTAIQRRLSIIGILQDFYDWQDPQLLANLLEVTPKTILSDVESINNDWKGKIGIEYLKEKGIRLDDRQQNKIRTLAHDIMEESESFQFLEKIFFDPDKDAEYWMRELFVSEATFYRMVRQIDGVLHKRGLSLERKPFRVIASDERWVRIFYTCLFSEKYDFGEWPFDLPMVAVLKFVSAAGAAFEVPLSDRNVMEYGFLAAVGVIRTAQGFYNLEHMTYSQATLEKLKPLQQIAEKALEESRYQTSDNWYHEMMYSLFLDYFITCHDGGEIKASVEEFLDKLSSSFEARLAPQDKQNIAKNMAQMHRSHQIYPYNRMILFNQAAFFSRTAQNYYPHFSKEVQQLLVEMEETEDFPWFSQFYFQVLQVLFQNWGHIAQSLDFYSPKVKILVVSDSGQQHGQLLAELIQSRFYYRVTVQVFERPIWYLLEVMADLADYDLVLANFSIKDYPHSNLQYVDDFLNEVDFTQIDNIVKKVR